MQKIGRLFGRMVGLVSIEFETCLSACLKYSQLGQTISDVNHAS